MKDLSTSGDFGFCQYVGHTGSMILTWDGNTVIDVDCQYKICGHANQCEMYQRHPIGFQKIKESK